MMETGKEKEERARDENANISAEQESASLSDKSFSRRKFLMLSGGIAAAAMFPGIALGGGRSRAAAAVLPNSPRFSLSGSGGEMFRDVSLGSATVMQSFGFDSVNNAIYTVQITYGSPSSSGDLTVTKLSMTGTILGQMALKGFGHGVSIGVEPSGTSAYLWTETDGVVDGADNWGSRICRFPFANGTTMYNTNPYGHSLDESE